MHLVAEYSLGEYSTVHHSRKHFMGGRKFSPETILYKHHRHPDNLLDIPLWSNSPINIHAPSSRICVHAHLLPSTAVLCVDKANKIVLNSSSSFHFYNHYTIAGMRWPRKQRETRYCRFPISTAFQRDLLQHITIRDKNAV